MLRRWGLLLVLCVCVASLAGNVWLYLELKARPAVSPALAAHPSPMAVPALAADRHVASTGRPSSPSVGQQSPEEHSTPAGNNPPVKTSAECARIGLEEFRTQLRDAAQRQQIKDTEIAAARQQAEAQSGLQDLHLNEQQLNRIYELSVEWILQSAETDDPQSRNRSPPEENPLIAVELGADVAAKWAKWQREAGGRSQVREIAGRMASEDVPLTRDQRIQMTELYTALDVERGGEMREKGIQSPTNEAEAIEMHQASIERAVRYRQKLVDRAASILSPRQLDILRRDSEQKAANRERAWEYLRSEGKVVQTDANGCVTAFMAVF
jgi:hypothetical protein